MITNRLLPLALILGLLPSAQAQYKAIFSFGASGDPSCSSSETLAQTPGGSLISTDHSGCTTNSWTTSNKPAAYEIGFQGADFKILQQFTEPWEWPLGGLTLGADQRFHGTTNEGGSRNHGMVYRLSPTGSIVYQHSFEGGADGGYPWAAPIQGADGAFYGTTAGASSAYAGTVYKIDPSGRYSVLHLFSTTDGRAPINSLVQGTDLNFYGTTLSGGLNGMGTFFRISSTGDFSVLYNFDSTDGGSPVGPLIQASDGNFYGATSNGDPTNNGAVLKMTPSGTVAVLYKFAGGQDGSQPGGGLIEATDGNFYGTLTQEGAAGGGTLYRLTPAGIFTKLHDFRIQTGYFPQNTVMQHTSGEIYGTTWAGGTNNDGVIWEYDPGLEPFVTFLNVYGQVGAKVNILGQYFAAGVSTVYFNGVPAKNPVITPTYIEATVPAGATTGFITVTTSKGTLKSNKPFVVY
jgi:uncharacterized repeat protein (TIGR03803 family)